MRSRGSTRLAAFVALAVLGTGCVHPRSVTPLALEGAVPVLWRSPTTAAPKVTRPRPPFRFVKEDLDGDSPKFTVVDGNDAEWRVKLGPEAHTEVVAGALLTATGFFADEMHYLARTRVSGIERLTRGREFVDPDGYVRGAQFEARPLGVTRGGAWEWSRNPFTGTDPLDGLRVLMVLINNYDARGANNRILLTTAANGERQARYVVTDLGASFGGYGGMGGRRTKSNLQDYRDSRFVTGVDGGFVEFGYRTAPERFGLTMFVFNPFYAFGELQKQRDMDRVPVRGVRWIARLLQQVAPDTIRTAFESAGYSGADAVGFTTAVQDRIRQLAAL